MTIAVDLGRKATKTKKNKKKKISALMANILLDRDICKKTLSLMHISNDNYT